MPDTPPTPQPEPWRTRLWDFTTWAISAAIADLYNLGHIWRNASPRERNRLIVAVVFVIASVVVASVAPWWSWLLVAALTVNAFADLGDVALAVAERKKTIRLLEYQPTGAPRVAEIRCSRGATHRFLYGPGGWEEAGPAVHELAEA